MKTKIKRSLVVLATSVLMLSACGNNNPEPEPEPEPEVVKRVESVALDVSEKTLTVGENFTLHATITPADADNVALDWTTSNPDVAEVIRGKVLALSVGKATILVKSKDNEQATAVCEVTVVEKDTTKHVTDVKLSVDQINLDLNGTNYAGLTADVIPEDATNRKITSEIIEGSNIITYKDNVVTATGTGTAKIRFTSEDGNHTKTCSITVTDSFDYASELSVSSESISLDENSSKDLTAQVTYLSGAKDSKVTWTSSNPELAYVQDGKVVAGKLSSTESVKVTLTATADVKKADKTTLTKTVEVTVNHVPTSEDVHVKDFHFDSSRQVAIDVNNHETKEIILSATDFISEVEGLSPANKEINFSIKEGSTQDAIQLEAIAGGTSVKVTAQGLGVVTIVATPANPLSDSVKKECVITITDSVNHITAIHLVDGYGNDIDEVAGLVGATAELAFRYEVEDKDKDFNKDLSFVVEGTAVSFTGKTISFNQAVSNLTVVAKSAQDPSVTFIFHVSVINPQHATEIYLSQNTVNLKVNKTTSADLSALYEVRNYAGARISNQTVSYEVTSGANIVSVNEHGIVSASGAGSAQVTLTAAADTATGLAAKAVITVEVAAADAEVITSLELPISIESYEKRSADEHQDSTEALYANGAALEATVDQYFKSKDDAERAYKIGTRGIFKFAPTVRYINSAGQAGVISGAEYDNKLYKYNGLSYDIVELSDYATLETGNNFTFKSSAAGEQFKLVVNATSQSGSYQVTSDPVEFAFTVIDNAYNAYNLYDLSYIDNSNSWWDAYRPTSAAVNSVIMHRDISLSNSEIPAAARYTKDEVNDYIQNHKSDFQAWAKRAYGSESDPLPEEGSALWQTAYNAFVDSPRDIESQPLFNTRTNGRNVTFEGNFFKFDASGCKQIALISSGDDTLIGGLDGDGSHSTIFGVNIEPQTTESLAGSYTMNNVTIIGNGRNADKEIYKGGYIALKGTSSDITVNNAIMKQSFTSVFTRTYYEGNFDTFEANFNRVKSNDTFNSATYIWGTKHNNFTDCWFANAGGPLFLLDEPFGDDEKHRVYPDGVTKYVTGALATNCWLNNPVNGDEAWFRGHEGATGLVKSYLIDAGNPQNELGWIGKCALGVKAAYHLDSRTITDLTKGVVNFIAIDVCARHFADNTTDKLIGSFQVKNPGTAFNGKIEYDSLTKNAYRTTTAIPSQVCPIIVQSYDEDGVSKGVGGISVTISELPKQQIPYWGDETDAFNVATEAQDFYTNSTSYQNLSQILTSQYISFYLDPVLGLSSETNGEFIGVLLGTYAL